MQVFDVIGYFILILILVSLVTINHGADMELILKTLDTIPLKEYVNITPDSTPIMKVVGATVDYTIYVSIEVAKAGIIFGAEHLHIAPETIIYLVIAALAAPLIIPLVKLLIIIGILLNELRLKLKEKKRKQKFIIQQKKEAQQNNGKIE